MHRVDLKVMQLVIGDKKSSKSKIIKAAMINQIQMNKKRWRQTINETFLQVHIIKYLEKNFDMNYSLLLETTTRATKMNILDTRKWFKCTRLKLNEGGISEPKSRINLCSLECLEGLRRIKWEYRNSQMINFNLIEESNQRHQL